MLHSLHASTRHCSEAGNGALSSALLNDNMTQYWPFPVLSFFFHHSPNPTGHAHCLGNETCPQLGHAHTSEVIGHAHTLKRHPVSLIGHAHCLGNETCPLLGHAHTSEVIGHAHTLKRHPVSPIGHAHNTTWLSIRTRAPRDSVCRQSFQWASDQARKALA